MNVTSFAGVAPPSKLPAIVIVSSDSNPVPAALTATDDIFCEPSMTTSNVAFIPSNSDVPATAVNVVDAVYTPEEPVGDPIVSIAP